MITYTRLRVIYRSKLAHQLRRFLPKSITLVAHNKGRLRRITMYPGTHSVPAKYKFLRPVSLLEVLTFAVVKERIDEFVGMFELGDFIDKRGEEYSQGMRQRIVLSAALIHDPDVLIIDEPLVGLDPRSSRLVKDTLKQRTTQGLTIFMSTHLLEIVEELCDRIAIIKQGRIIYEESQSAARRSNGQLETMFLELTK